MPGSVVVAYLQYTAPITWEQKNPKYLLTAVQASLSWCFSVLRDKQHLKQDALKKTVGDVEIRNYRSMLKSMNACDS